MNEVLAQKITSLQRCVARAREELQQAGDAFGTDRSAQDAALLNVIRACETALDIANMIIRRRRLGIPRESRDSFAILARENAIDEPLAARLLKMVGFRNLAVHRYHELDMAIVESVIRKDLDDLLAFAEAARRLLQ